MIVYRDGPRFFIDECLTRSLLSVARARGYEARHVKQEGLEGRSDAALAVLALELGEVFVTNNARDFRHLYARFRRHPGLVIILPSVKKVSQCNLFDKVLTALASSPDIETLLVEVDVRGQVTRRPWPEIVPPENSTD